MVRCACGTRISKFSTRCRDCHKVSMIQSAMEFETIAQKGRCPCCGDVLVYNHSLADAYWLQCQNYGNLRKDMSRSPCSYQILAGLDEVNALRNSFRWEPEQFTRLYKTVITNPNQKVIIDPVLFKVVAEIVRRAMLVVRDLVPDLL